MLSSFHRISSEIKNIEPDIEIPFRLDNDLPGNSFVQKNIIYIDEHQQRNKFIEKTTGAEQKEKKKMGNRTKAIAESEICQGEMKQVP